MSREAAFVDRMRDEIIQRANSVMACADILWGKKMLTSEAYSRINNASPSQNQIRELYNSLNAGGNEVKIEFYKALLKNESFLVKELEQKFATRDKDRQPTESLSTSLDAKGAEASLVAEECLELDKKWQQKSQKWKETLRKLIYDPGRLKKGTIYVFTEIQYKIGQGSNQTDVYVGIRGDGTEVAVKVMRKDGIEELKNEISLLTDPKLESKHVVRYIDFVEENQIFYLALQLCDYNLDEYLELHKRKEKQKDLKEIAKEVLDGLQVLHEADVLHRDLKPNNVLIDEEENVRLADFGISRKLMLGASTLKTKMSGTPGWMAAEILLCNGNEKLCEYRKSADIQVAGMLVYYILSGKHHPFGDDYSVFHNILQGTYRMDEVKDVEAIDLIQSMIEKEHDKRPTAKEAVNHPYFWNDGRRDSFLRRSGDEKQIQKFKETDEDFLKVVAELTEGRSFSGWKSKISPHGLSVDQKLPDDLLGLFRFLRNTLIHKKDVFDQNNMFRDEFPDFFICAHKLAKKMKWDV